MTTSLWVFGAILVLTIAATGTWNAAMSVWACGSALLLALLDLN